MQILPGFEDLKPKEILGFDDMGFALVQSGESIKRYKMLIGPGGQLVARPYVEAPHPLPDQIPETRRLPRQRSYDQM